LDRGYNPRNFTTAMNKILYLINQQSMSLNADNFFGAHTNLIITAHNNTKCIFFFNGNVCNMLLPIANIIVIKLFGVVVGKN
jgi:hypothetical protein